MSQGTLIPVGFGAVMLILTALAIATAHSDQTIGTGQVTTSAPLQQILQKDH